jgi:adenylosuccinate synthase
VNTAYAVIGANYGDEGKGQLVDYLVDRERANLVVRFNGGAQAGHTVETPRGTRFVFHHFGSGTLAGAATFLSRFFIVNPALFRKEHADLSKIAMLRPVYVDPACLVTTPFDMTLNQLREDARGSDRHGSCGAGMWETIVRNREPNLQLTVADLNDQLKLPAKLMWILQNYRHERALLGLDYDEADKIADMFIYWQFIKDCAYFISVAMQTTLVSSLLNDGVCVFEGAQGLLLGEEQGGDDRYLTPSSTGLKNVLTLANEWGITELEAWYVSRTYLTRHGAGPLPNEGKRLAAPYPVDPTNTDNPYQGALRYAPLDPDALNRRIAADVNGVPLGVMAVENQVRVTKRLAYTWTNFAYPRQSEGGLWFYGPTRANVIAWHELANTA